MNPEPNKPSGDGRQTNNFYNNLPLPPSQPATPVKPATSQHIADQPLSATKIETPQPAVKKGPSWLRDLFGLASFVLVVVIGAYLINTFIFRSFNVVGPSMEPTLEGGVNDEPNDRLIVNRVPVTLAKITGNPYVPARGQIIVFQNPKWVRGEDDEYVVKRVIGLPGERVTVNDCVLKVYNDDHPDGFDPYPTFHNLGSDDSTYNDCVDGNGTNVTIPDDEIFVVGDHRVGSYSMDSRNGDNRASLGTIPLENIVGPVTLRIWPFDHITTF
ncbi:MAG: signal peptidase I [Sphaerimonospora mesophila]